MPHTSLQPQSTLPLDPADLCSLDKEDDAMNRWKASLGLATGNSISDPNDPRLCIIKSLALVSPQRLAAWCTVRLTPW